MQLYAIGATVPTLAWEILTDLLSERLRLSKIYPVVFTTSYEALSGWCCSRTQSPEGEISLTSGAANSPGQLLDVYCHELAHRLMYDADFDLRKHGWPFAAMQATLLLRAANHINGRPRIQSLKCYDVHDEPMERWGWAIQQALDVANKLAELPISAEECAEEIRRIWFEERYPRKRKRLMGFW